MTSAAEVPQTDSDAGPVTLINVFEIGSDEVELFLAEWRKRAEFMTKQPGFRSLKLHRALMPDARFQLVNVAEWDSAEALHAATAQQSFQEGAHRLMQEVKVTPHPAIYRVALEVAAPELSEQPQNQT
ncbi:MAG: antibiotic biosynthesis monooxygenase [Mycobacterium sp.]|nr:antibiotic biosynthesis monooxygenase [Mycobacterium sp.]